MVLQEEVGREAGQIVKDLAGHAGEFGFHPGGSGASPNDFKP